MFQDQAQLDYVMTSLAREKQVMDVEDFQRLLVTARAVAVSRAANLVKFAADKSAMIVEGEVKQFNNISIQKDCYFLFVTLERKWAYEVIQVILVFNC